VALSAPLDGGRAVGLRDQLACFPTTRYQGSKRRYLPALAAIFSRLEFHTALDGFSGTGCVAYLLKAMGRRVTCNDVLAANAEVARALVANDAAHLDDEDIRALLREPLDPPRSFITDTFDGIYFARAENSWLDAVTPRIAAMPNRTKRAVAWFSLFQACLAKRPYNLFHRRNLYMRTSNVPRSFGNKATWDRPFAEHFTEFARQANRAVFAAAEKVTVRKGDVVAAPGQYDLVYLDPPYLNRHGRGVDYAGFYHFLEGLLDYDRWPERIDWQSKHRRLRSAASPWTDPRGIHAAFEAAFERFADAALVVSYRSDGIPGIAELAAMLRRFKKRVDVHELTGRSYALSTNRTTREVVLVGQ
jgi:adenine-specific DNA methylase